MSAELAKPHPHEDLFKKHERLIHKRAWDFYHSTGVPYEELLSEGYLCFCMTARKYRPEKGAFSTFLWTCLTHSFSDFCSRWRNIGRDEDLPPIVVCSEYSQCNNPSSSLIFTQSLSTLSEEACHIVHLVINSPKEFLRDLPSYTTPRAIRGGLFRHLRRKGWSWPRIWGGLRELKEAFGAER